MYGFLWCSCALAEKSLSRREEQKKTKKREGNFWLKQNKQKRRTNKKETTETRNWPNNTFLSFITQHTLLLLLLLNNNRHRQHEQHGGHPRIGRREDAVLHLERREQQRHLSKPSQGGGRRVRESLGFTKEGVSESFGRAQSWTRRESEEVERFWFCVLREREREIDWFVMQGVLKHFRKENDNEPTRSISIRFCVHAALFHSHNNLLR